MGKRIVHLRVKEACILTEKDVEGCECCAACGDNHEGSFMRIKKTFLNKEYKYLPESGQLVTCRPCIDWMKASGL